MTLCREKRTMSNHHRLTQTLRKVEISGGEDNWEWDFAVGDERKVDDRDERLAEAV